MGGARSNWGARGVIQPKNRKGGVRSNWGVRRETVYIFVFLRSLIHFFHFSFSLSLMFFIHQQHMNFPVVVRRRTRRRHHRKKKDSFFKKKMTFSKILFLLDPENQLSFFEISFVKA
jgi:hypothetical protein